MSESRIGCFGLVIDMTVSFDRIAEKYDETREPPPQRFIHALQNELKGFKVVADFGAGTGRYAEPLQRSGLEVLCLDISRKMLEQARKRGLVYLITSDLRALPLRDGCIDAGFVFAVLHLMENYRKAVEEIMRVTKHLLIGGLDQTVPENVPFHHSVYAEKLLARGITPKTNSGGGTWLRQQPPLRKVFVAEEKGSFSGDRMIEYLASRHSSITWDVPEDVHGEIIRELTSEYSRKAFDYRVIEYLLVWNVRELQGDLLH